MVDFYNEATLWVLLFLLLRHDGVWFTTCCSIFVCLVCIYVCVSSGEIKREPLICLVHCWNPGEKGSSASGLWYVWCHGRLHTHTNITPSATIKLKKKWGAKEADPVSYFTGFRKFKTVCVLRADAAFYFNFVQHFLQDTTGAGHLLSWNVISANTDGLTHWISPPGSGGRCKANVITVAGDRIVFSN